MQAFIDLPKQNRNYETAQRSVFNKTPNSVQKGIQASHRSNIDLHVDTAE